MRYQFLVETYRTGIQQGIERLAMFDGMKEEGGARRKEALPGPGDRPPTERPDR